MIMANQPEKKADTFSQEEASDAVDQFYHSAVTGGVYNYVCDCGQICGQRLAIAGPPPSDIGDVVACPCCDEANITVVYAGPDADHCGICGDTGIVPIMDVNFEGIPVLAGEVTCPYCAGKTLKD
jgi:hypothetical protein